MARDTLAQIQALHMEVAQVTRAHHDRGVEVGSGKMCARSTSVKGSSKQSVRTHCGGTVETGFEKMHAQTTSIRKYSLPQSVKPHCDRTIEAGSGNKCTRSASVKKCSSTQSASVSKCSSAQSVVKRAGVSHVSSLIQNGAGNKTKITVPR